MWIRTPGVQYSIYCTLMKYTRIMRVLFIMHMLTRISFGGSERVGRM